jgi:hypothetical protein
MFGTIQFQFLIMDMHLHNYVSSGKYILWYINNLILFREDEKDGYKFVDTERCDAENAKRGSVILSDWTNKTISLFIIRLFSFICQTFIFHFNHHSDYKNRVDY